MKRDDPPLPEPKGWEDDWKLAFPKEYLGAEHLRGQDVTLTISRVLLPELTMVKPGMKPKKARKLIIEFDALKGRTDGTPYKWIVNKTNSRAIMALHGKAPRDWAGKRITLWPDPEVEMPNPAGRGQITGEAIRVRPTITQRDQQRARGDAPPPHPPAQESPPPAAGAPDEEELREIARREQEER